MRERFVEEVSDAEHVHGSDCDHAHGTGESTSHAQNAPNRNERKVRSEFEKAGLVRVTGISRVAFKRGRMVFAITNPDVYKNPTSDSYVVFGEAKVEDHSAFQSQMMAARRMAESAATGNFNSSAAPVRTAAAERVDTSDNEKDKADTDEEEEEETPDYDMREGDINIVMEQASVSRSKAIRALRAKNNDIVDAIMELSM